MKRDVSELTAKEREVAAWYDGQDVNTRLRIVRWAVATGALTQQEGADLEREFCDALN